MIKYLTRLLCLAFIGATLTASAQRKTFYIDIDYPEMTHANGSKTLADMGTLAANKVRYDATYKWWTLILGQTDATFQTMTLASAVLNQCLWAGNGSGFAPGVTCTSRNNTERIPGGVYMINVGVRVLQGRFIGGGTSIGLNGNASTELVYDHARWQDPAPIRAVVLSANWGSSDYLESCYIDGIRVSGRAPNWLDPSYTQHGIALRMMGETAVLDRAYVEQCNGHGVWVNGAGPGKINHLTAFDNNLAGLYVTNDKTGAAAGNSLGMLQVGHLSCDNNAWAFLGYGAPAMAFGYIKNEDGLSAQRGRPKKDQVTIEAHGWINITVDQITDAVRGTSGPTIVLNSTANKSRLTVGHYSQIANNGDVNEGRSALVADVRSKQAWRPSDQNAGEFRAMRIEWTGYGTASTMTCSEALVSIPFNGTTRLGIASTYAGYDYAGAKPVWDPTGGTVTPPPPTACTFAYSAWTTNCPGTQTRTYTATPAGCVGVPPSDSLSRACTVTPPPTSGGIDPADVLVVWNTADPRTQGWASTYATSWGIPSGNIISVNAGTTHNATAAVGSAVFEAVKAKGKQYTVLAWEYPSRMGSQSITSVVTFDARSVSGLTTSVLYNYAGFKPRTDKGVAPSFLLVSDKYIRRDAHGTKPTGQSILLLAKDQTGTPRGSARAGQTAPGLTVWDNRTYSGIGNGQNACNYISSDCWRNDRKPGTTPIVAAYQSMYILGSSGSAVWAKGFYGDHVTSFGGYLPAGTNGSNSQGQTPLTYHLDKGASLSVGSVSEPWQGSGGSLAVQFVDASKFHPLFLGGSPVGVAAWSAVKCPDRMLFAGDGLTAPFK